MAYTASSVNKACARKSSRNGASFTPAAASHCLATSSSQRRNCGCATALAWGLGGVVSAAARVHGICLQLVHAVVLAVYVLYGIRRRVCAAA
eukprot:3802580-Rhodomonas_salina.1